MFLLLIIISKSNNYIHLNMKKTILITLVFNLIIFFYSLPANAVNYSSRLTGLFTLKTMEKTSVDYNSAIANHKPSLIEFYAEWCPSCQKLAPTLQTIHKTYQDEINLVMINIDDVQWKEQIQQYHVMGIPHLVLLDKNHEIFNSWVGFIPEKILNNAVLQMLDS